VDTHVVLWWLLSSRRIRPEHAALLADPETTVWVSAATIWEIGIKRRLGKLRFSAPISESCLAAGFGLLPVGAQHAEAAGALDLHHRDLFDRLLVAQAQVEQMAIMTVDPVFDAYDVATV
jgi:PIN domain nuclease of toxin-antitoxin system